MWAPAGLNSSLLLYVAVLVLCCLSSVWSIMVPSGKLTPIMPAEPLAPGESKFSTPIRRTVLEAAPVYEYTNENPEPAPLDPSYVPYNYKYIRYLKKQSINYVPTNLKVPKYQQKYYQKYAKYPEQKYAKYPEHLRRKFFAYDSKSQH
ncbi:unnamed protein product [Bemisia tabaci]|uniref:Uncharacterized protein n=1 Tax=Bemisia tabaci TaxID=7038 RepID=A0A9P0CCB7_BEMTA|nr:PREDICTED: uncharacterized protein LOC109032621 [Bemisia tabaci]CAH0776763.1 unnamed protein product [Bemisia tabaci]